MAENGIKKVGINKKLLEAYRLVHEDRARKALEKAIARRGMSYEQIAFRLGTTAEQIHLYMAHGKMDLRGMSEIVLALGCELVPIITPEESPPTPAKE